MHPTIDYITAYCYNTVAGWKRTMTKDLSIPCDEPHFEHDRLLQVFMGLFDYMQADKGKLNEWSTYLKTNACDAIALWPVFQNFSGQVQETAGVQNKLISNLIKQLVDKQVAHSQVVPLFLFEKAACAKLGFSALFTYWFLHWLQDTSCDNESTLAMLDEHIRYLTEMNVPEAQMNA